MKCTLQAKVDAQTDQRDRVACCLSLDWHEPASASE